MAKTFTPSADSLARLKELCPTGTRVYGFVRHVSSSGMSRRISFYAIQDNKPVFLDGLFSNVTEFKRHKDKEGLIVGGCGMNMIMHVVTTVARVVHGHESAWSYEGL